MIIFINNKRTKFCQIAMYVKHLFIKEKWLFLYLPHGVYIVKCRRGAHLPSLPRPWARRWINHWNLWHMASATPDLRLPSQPQGVKRLAQVVTWKLNDRKSNSRPLSRKSNALTITSPGHTGYGLGFAEELALDEVLKR